MTTKKYRTRRLDENGDPVISGKVWIYDVDAVAQTIDTRLKLFAGEYWRDVTDGTPWIDRILTKNNRTNTLQSKIAILKERILQTGGVISILEWTTDFNYTSRNLSVIATVLTEFGVLNINEQLDEPQSIEDESVQQLLVSVQNYIVAVNNYTRL